MFYISRNITVYNNKRLSFTSRFYIRQTIVELLEQKRIQKHKKKQNKKIPYLINIF